MQSFQSAGQNTEEKKKPHKMNYLRSFWNSPTGLKTTHFWGPTFGWSLPLAVDCYLALY